MNKRTYATFIDCLSGLESKGRRAGVEIVVVLRHSVGHLVRDLLLYAALVQRFPQRSGTEHSPNSDMSHIGFGFRPALTVTNKRCIGLFGSYLQSSKEKKRYGDANLDWKLARSLRRSVTSIAIKLMAMLVTLFSLNATASGKSQRPNIIIIIADDLGYGDLSVQGHPLIRTPNIDRLAAEGQRWTSFYASASTCNPSRVALMTGRLPIRIHENGQNLWADLPNSEVTIAEFLKPLGYATGYIGKWGLTELRISPFDYPGAHPNQQGFDYFYGFPEGSWPWGEGVKGTYEDYKNATDKDFPVRLYRQDVVLQSPVSQTISTEKLTDESLKWLESNKDESFLLFLAFSAPHVPLFPSNSFKGHSKAGRYGDVVEEIDASVGRIIEAVRRFGVANDTLIFFTSDNGPWLRYQDLGGSAGPLRDGKHTVWEGGVRVPGIFWWPGRIRPSVVDGIGANVDLISTISALVGASLPTDRAYDSIDLSATLLQRSPSSRKEWFYFGSIYAGGKLEAARVDQYKLVLGSVDFIGSEGPYLETHKSYLNPLLFDLSTDLAERWNIADQHPEIVKAIKERVSRYKEAVPGMSK